jgi:hypothetical protein
MVRKVIQLHRVDTGAEAVVIATVDRDSVEYNVLSENDDVRQDLRSLLKSFIFNLSPANVSKKLVYKAKISIPDTKEHLINLIDLLSWNGYVVKQISDKTFEKSALGLDDEQDYHTDLVERHYPVLPILSYYLKSLNNQESRNEVLKSFSPSVGGDEYTKIIGDKQYLIRVPPGYMLEHAESGKVYLPGQFVGQIPIDSLGEEYLVIPIPQEGREISEDERNIVESAFTKLKNLLVKKLNELAKDNEKYKQSKFNVNLIQEIVGLFDEKEKKEFLDNLSKLSGIVGENLPNIISLLLSEVEEAGKSKKVENEQSGEQEKDTISYDDIIGRLSAELNIPSEKKTRLSGKYVDYGTILKELLRYALREKNVSKEDIRGLLDRISVAKKAQKFGVIARDENDDLVLVKLPDVLQDEELRDSLLAAGKANVVEDPFTKDPRLAEILLKDYLFLFTNRVPIISENGQVSVDNWDTIKPYLNFLFNVLLRNIDAATSRNVKDYLRETSSAFATNPNLSDGDERYHGRRLPEYPGDAVRSLIENLKEAGVRNVPLSIMLNFASGEEIKIKNGSLIDLLIKEGILTTRQPESEEFFANLERKLNSLKLDIEKLFYPLNPNNEEKQKKRKNLGPIYEDILSILSMISPDQGRSSSQGRVKVTALNKFLTGLEEFKKLATGEEYVRVLHSFGDEDSRTITKEFVQKQEEYADHVEAKIYGIFFDGRNIYSENDIRINLKDYVDYLFSERKIITKKMSDQLKRDIDLIFGDNGIVKESRITFLGFSGKDLDERKEAFARVVSLLIQNPLKDQFDRLYDRSMGALSTPLYLDKVIEEDAKKILGGRFLDSLVKKKNSIYLYQLYGIAFSLNKTFNRHQGGFSEKVGSILFWEGGLGKTVTQIGTILLGKDLGIINPDKPVLIFAPENVIGNWVRDAQNVFGLENGFIVPDKNVLVVRDVDTNKREASYKLLTLLYALKQIDRRLDELRAKGVDLTNKEFAKLSKKKAQLEAEYKELTGSKSVPERLPDIVLVGTYKTQRASKESTADRLFNNDSRSLITMSRPFRVRALAIPYVKQQQGYLSSSSRRIVDIDMTIDDGVFGAMVIDEAGMVMNPETLRHRTMAAIKAGITSDRNKGLVWLLNAEEVATSPANTAALINLAHYYGNILDPKSVYLYKVRGRNIYLWKSGALRVLRTFSSKLTNDTIYGQRIKGYVKSSADGVTSKKVEAVIGDQGALLEFDLPLVKDNFSNEELRVLPHSEDAMLKPLIVHTALDLVINAKSALNDPEVEIKTNGYALKHGAKVDVNLEDLAKSYRPALLQMQREALLGIFPRDRAFEYGFDKNMHIKVPNVDIVKELFGSTGSETKEDKIRELYKRVSEGQTGSTTKTIREMYLDVASSVATHLYGVTNEQEFKRDFEKALDELLFSLRKSLGSVSISVQDISEAINGVFPDTPFSPFSVKTSDGKLYGLTDEDKIYFPNYSGGIGKGDDLSADVEDVDDIQRQEAQEEQGVSMFGVGERKEEFNLRKNFIRARNIAMSAVFNLAMWHARKLIELDLDSEYVPFSIELARNGDDVHYRIYYYVKEDGKRKRVEYDPARFQSQFNLSQRKELKQVLDYLSDPNTEYDMEGDTVKIDPHTLLSLFINFYQDANVYENNKAQLSDAFSLSANPILGFERKSIILSPSRKHAASIYRIAKLLNDPVHTAVGAIVGGTPVDKQEQIIQQHTQRGKKTITVLTTRAAGRGLNLPSSKTVVFSPYSYEELRQALARGLRSAQLFTDISTLQREIASKKELLKTMKDSEEKKKLAQEIQDKESHLESLSVVQRTVMDAATVFPVLQRTVLATLQDVASKPKLPSAKKRGERTTATELDERARTELHNLAEQINTWLGLERTEGYLRRYRTLAARVSGGQQAGILGALGGWLGRYEKYDVPSEEVVSKRLEIIGTLKKIMQNSAKDSNLTDEEIEKLIHGIFV